MDWNGKGGYNGDLPLVRFDCRLIKVVDVFAEDLHRVRICLDSTRLCAGVLVEGGGGWWLIVWSWRAHNMRMPILVPVFVIYLDKGPEAQYF